MGGQPLIFYLTETSMSAPDGLVLLPKAGGYSTADLIEQQTLTNRQRAVEHAKAQIQNITFSSAVKQMDETCRGVLADWNNGSDRSLSKLFVSDNRLQGLGMLLIVLAVGGIFIDAVLNN